MSLDKIKFPPFGKKIFNELYFGKPKDVLRNCGFIKMYIGEACWEIAQIENHKAYALYLPDNKNPADYDWPVSGFHVWVFIIGEKLGKEFFDRLAEILFHDGAISVEVICFKSHPHDDVTIEQLFGPIKTYSYHAE